MKELPRLRYPGGIDADGHVVEPPDMWQRYIDPRHRDVAMAVRIDDKKKEYLDLGGGRMSKVIRNGYPVGVALMDRLGGIVYEREPRTGSPYIDSMPLGAMDPKERLQRLDMENVEPHPTRMPEHIVYESTRGQEAHPFSRDNQPWFNTYWRVFRANAETAMAPRTSAKMIQVRRCFVMSPYRHVILAGECRSRRREHVSLSSYGQENPRLRRRVPQLLAQARAVHVDGAGLDAVGIETPHP